MKTQKILFVILLFLFFSSSCDNNENEEPNFYNQNHRIGLWTNPISQDTLDFVDNKNLIRKGKVFVYEEYEYRIDEDILYLKNSKYSKETKHQITIKGANIIILGGMLLTTEFKGDGSSSYIKVKK